MKSRVVAIGLLFFSMPCWAVQYFVELGWVDSASPIYQQMIDPTLTEQVYRDHADQRLWFDLTSANHFEDRLAVIHRAGFSPLFDRQLALMQAYRQQQRWYEYDVLATDTLLQYLSYAEQAAKVGLSWFFDGQLTKPLVAPSEAALLALYNALSTQTLSDLIDQTVPQNPAYQQLLHAYQSLLALESQPMALYEQDNLTRPGDLLMERDVLLLRLSLVNLEPISLHDGTDFYDANLVALVKQFQNMHGLTPDGIIGPQTIKWLNTSVTERLAILALNAERIRLWSTQQESLILVNIPAFAMQYWDEGEQVFAAKVVVGRVTRPTPVMNTKLDSLIINPIWNVPHKIMMEDILPLVKRDHEYLAKHRIEIIRGWDDPEVMDPRLIDWANVNPETFPYRLRQLAGSNNSLGAYKFNTPNSQAIYLHDTPNKNLFNRASRAFSSGCIRVENAQKFAQSLLTQQGIALTSLPSGTRTIALKKRIPVQIIYQTAWYEDGTLHYRDDIYGYDEASTVGHG
ncbi:L,D-transpeptidase family protein [Vibrio sp. HDW18]|uniref:L,D-transpeptidase family protein n=1 Tax=Vibrio sp. HDW18 TaxID=2714948 RepID=UPI001407BF5A|nr:L,D-transpeptidase family protein [Vibrio sp. HDW18]QIL84548.1 L,D-transpeptidase family protein [Vibrio sp. HDW18]